MSNLGNNDGGAVAGSFNFAAQLPNGKSLTFSGYVLAGETEEEVNEKLDFASRAVERQRLIAEIPELEAKLSQTVDAKGQVETILAELQTKSGTLTSQDKMSLKTHTVNLQHLTREVEKGEAAIAKSRRLLAARTAG